jgi:CobQ-like glutamine amidotransferase family enzyme
MRKVAAENELLRSKGMLEVEAVAEITALDVLEDGGSQDQAQEAAAEVTKVEALAEQAALEVLQGVQLPSLHSSCSM